MSLPLPTNTPYASLLSGYFGHLDGGDQDALWSLFLTRFEIPSSPTEFKNDRWTAYLRAQGETDFESITPAQLQVYFTAFINQPSLQVLFRQFLDGTYTQMAKLEQSPDEIRGRHIVFTIFDILVALMRSIQDSISVLGQSVINLSNIKRQYSEQMSRVTLYQANSPNTPSIDTDDLSKWTLGYSNITIKDYLTTALGQSAAQAPADTLFGENATKLQYLLEGLVPPQASLSNPFLSTDAASISNAIIALLPELVANALTQEQRDAIDKLAAAVALKNGDSPPQGYPLSWLGESFATITDVAALTNADIRTTALGGTNYTLNATEEAFLDTQVLTLFKTQIVSLLTPLNTSQSALNKVATALSIQNNTNPPSGSPTTNWLGQSYTTAEAIGNVSNPTIVTQILAATGVTLTAAETTYINTPFTPSNINDTLMTRLKTLAVSVFNSFEPIILSNVVGSSSQAQTSFDNLASTNKQTVKDAIRSMLPQNVVDNLTGAQSTVIDALAEGIAETNDEFTPTYDPLYWLGRSFDSVSDLTNFITEDNLGPIIFLRTALVFNPSQREFFRNQVIPPFKTQVGNLFTSLNTASTVTTGELKFQRVGDELIISFYSPQNATTPIVETVTIPPDTTFTNMLDIATAAFKTLLTRPSTAGTVLDAIEAANLAIPWPTALNAPFETDPDVANTNADKRAQKNQLMQQYIESIRVKREVIANLQDSQTTTLDQARQGLTQTAKIISAAIRQLENVLQAIFKAA